MSITAIKPAVEQKKPFKARIEVLSPTDIVDCWRLLERSMREAPQDYPIHADAPEAVRSYLFQYMTNPGFLGLSIRVGRKLVGQVLGEVAGRPLGKPRSFCFIWNFWIEPEFRKRGAGAMLWKEFLGKLRNMGITHWEGNGVGASADQMAGLKIAGARTLYRRIGGEV